MPTRRIETIYVALLGTGAAAWLPVQAERRPDGSYEILSRNDDPEHEQWQFSSGSLVRCVPRELAVGTCLVASERVAPAPLLKLWTVAVES
jgi:hypothetical protein